MQVLFFYRQYKNVLNEKKGTHNVYKVTQLRKNSTRTQKTASALYTEPKSTNDIASPTVQVNPIPKKVQKIISDQLIHSFTIMKGSPISLYAHQNSITNKFPNDS